MEKEEIAHNEQFLLFPQCFLLNQKIISPLLNNYDIISVFAAELEELKIGIRGKGLRSACSVPMVTSLYLYWPHHIKTDIIFVVFVEDNAIISLILYFENRVSYFVQNRRK